MNVAWGTQRRERGSTGVETSSRMGVVTRNTAERMRRHGNGIIDLGRGWTMGPSKTSINISLGPPEPPSEALKSIAAIFRLTIADIAKLSRSIRDHSTYPPFPMHCCSDTAFMRRKAMQRGCVGGSATCNLRKVQAPGRRLTRLSKESLTNDRHFRQIITNVSDAPELALDVKPEAKTGEKTKRIRARRRDKRKTKGKRSKEESVRVVVTTTRDGLELTLKPRHWPFHPYPIRFACVPRMCVCNPLSKGREPQSSPMRFKKRSLAFRLAAFASVRSYAFQNVTSSRGGTNSGCLYYCYHSYDAKGRRACFVGENCGGCNKGGSTGDASSLARKRENLNVLSFVKAGIIRYISNVIKGHFPNIPSIFLSTSLAPASDAWGNLCQRQLLHRNYQENRRKFVLIISESLLSSGL
ncbi:hypothetical protein EAG_10619 [Camponotus floridanus]|uniref:Uncharacterized protein n=1 Tax=Camponotus floridanus TaxID=104421 RepID=E2AWH2_CAMFO|nr:hypothetical protein EAG_10619 [Camponotus floridanus]